MRRGQRTLRSDNKDRHFDDKQTDRQTNNITTTNPWRRYKVCLGASSVRHTNTVVALICFLASVSRFLVL